MSDDWNPSSLEEHVRENAGVLGLAAALHSHSQREEQLNLLKSSVRQQEEIARTEAQRLEIESQRLELERLKQRSEKDEKEAVRILRVMMADVGAEFDNLETRGDFKNSPNGLRRDYAMAVQMSKLELVRSRSGGLSDLNDLKELLRLENLARDLVSKQFPGGHPLELTRAKWAELQVWMQGVERIGIQVKQICASVPDPTAVQLPSRAVLAALQVKMEGFATQLKFDLNQHASSLPSQAASEGILLDELAEQALLEDLSIGKNPIRAKAFADFWRQVAVTRMFVQDVQVAIQRLNLWKNKADEHDYALQELLVQVEEGRLNGANRSVIKIGRVRFDDLDYSPVSDLGKLEQTLVVLKTAKWKYVVFTVAELRRKYPKAGSKSELGGVLKAALARAARGEKVKETMALVGVAILSSIAIFFVYWLLAAKEVAVPALPAGYPANNAIDHYIADLKKAEKERAEAERTAAMAATPPTSSVSSTPPSLPMVTTDPLTAPAFPASRGMEGSRAGEAREFGGIEMVWCPPGEFLMGSPASEADRSDNETQHRVTLTKGFWMAKTETTQGQWESVMGYNPSHFKGMDLPVEKVSWDDVQGWLGKMNERHPLPAGWKWELPTEAQWEYACRAGTETAFAGDLDKMAWYFGKSGRKTNPVGTKQANDWGLHDMHGNVWEWCRDWYGDYPSGVASDPKGSYRTQADAFSDRVFRGGGWSNYAALCRSAYRGWDSPGRRILVLGFRVAAVPAGR